MRWLQLSDFHIGGPRGPQKEALKSLLDCIELLAQEGDEPISTVFLSGDIAYSGKEEEYETFVTAFLAPLRTIPCLSDVRIYCIPGNHDVNCDQALRQSWHSIGQRNQPVFFCEDDDGRAIRASRAATFEAYWKFVEKNSLIGPNPFEQVSAYYSDPTLPLEILATNTAFFSDREDDSSKPVTPIPLQSIRHLISPGSPKRSLLILGHHSPSSFLPEHLKQFETLLIDKSAFFIHGHEHNPKATFASDGRLMTLGFGASYLGSLGATTTTPYLNSFAECTLADRLRVRAYTWQPTVGRWVNTTSTEFASYLSAAKKDAHAVEFMVPLLDEPTEQSGSTVFSKIARNTVKIARIIPIGEPSDEVLSTFLRLSENISALYRRTEPEFRRISNEDGKITFSLSVGEKRHLMIHIEGLNHVLSAKELESFNTRLDTDDYNSVTVISFGRISEEAHALYVRLRSKKAIEVLVNKQLADNCEQILTLSQRNHLAALDTAKHTVSLLVAEALVYMLVVETGQLETFFYILANSGEIIPPSAPLVVALRANSPELCEMRYAGEEMRLALPVPTTVFDLKLYLEACYKQYNVIKYAALANVGIRFSDLPLEELYVEATANEVDDRTEKRLQAVVVDHLAKYPFSDALKAHIQEKLISSLRIQAQQEASVARDFCQKYGAVLVTGDPGSGKTCFVKSEILAYCKAASVATNSQSEIANWYASHIPVMVPLSELVAEKDLEATGLYVIASRIIERRGIPFPAKELEQLSLSGRIAWFFDGLDEVVSIEKRAIVVQHINNLVANTLPTGNRIVVTSRPAAVHLVNLLPALRKLEIQGLSDLEIRKLAERILRLKLVSTNEGLMVDVAATSRMHDALIDQLLHDCEHNPGVARLAQNPLLLTLLILIYANAGAPSAKRHRIYEQAVQTLASVRGREAGHQPISEQDLRERLGAVALAVYKRQSGLLPSRREVCEIVRGVMSRQRGEEISIAKASEFIQKVAESTGLIAVQNRPGESDEAAVVTFMHHSFLEFFAAIGLSRELDTCDFGELVAQSRWHEVLTLLAGIIGESEDVAPVLGRILGAKVESSSVDAKLLVFAMDCALECEVPSEAAQRMIAEAIRNCVTQGPARIDPWVRSEIGQRLGSLFVACGGGEFDSMFIELLKSDDSEISASAIMLTAVAFSSGYESARVLDAFGECCSRSEDIVLASICDAASVARELRTERALQVVGRCLRKSQRCKRAAFDALANIPSLAVDYWSEIINGIEDNNAAVSRVASAAAIQAGLNADLITLNASKKDMLLRALRNFDKGLTGMDMERPSVSTETIDRMLSSALIKDRLIGIQIMGLVKVDEQYAYNKLLEIISSEGDGLEISAAMNSFRLNLGPTALFLQRDLHTVVRWMKEGRSNVRVAAAHLLGRFGRDLVAVEALMERDLRELDTEDYCVTVQSLSYCRLLKERVSEKLFAELGYFLNEQRRMTEQNEQCFITLLGVFRQLEEIGASEIAGKLKRLVADHRYSLAVRKQAIICYVATSVPCSETIDIIKGWFTNPPIGMETQLVQIPAIFANSCKKSVDYVLATIEYLGPLRTVLLNFHSRLLQRRVTDDVEYQISELRNGITEISQILVAFDEFISA